MATWKQTLFRTAWKLPISRWIARIHGPPRNFLLTAMPDSGQKIMYKTCCCPHMHHVVSSIPEYTKTQCWVGNVQCNIDSPSKIIKHSTMKFLLFAIKMSTYCYSQIHNRSLDVMGFWHHFSHIWRRLFTAQTLGGQTKHTSPFSFLKILKNEIVTLKKFPFKSVV
jgi:hypothetical protein